MVIVLALTVFICTFSSVQGSVIRFKVLDGKCCAPGTLDYKGVSIPVTIMIDLGFSAPFYMHDKTAEMMQIVRDDVVTLRFDGGMELRPPTVPVGLEMLEELTAEYAEELGEIPVAGLIGMPALQEYQIILEMGEGQLTLLPGSEFIEADWLPAGTAERWVSYESRSNGFWLDGVAGDDYEVQVRFTPSVADTLIDSVVTDIAGAPAGDLEQLMVGGVNAANYVALRPEDLTQVSQSSPPDVMLGSNFLSHFKVVIDPIKERLALVESREIDFPYAEQAFFLARYNEDIEGIETFIQEHIDSRLAKEAVDLLWQLRIVDYPPDEAAYDRLLGYVAKVTKPNRRATALITKADEFLTTQHENRFYWAGKAYEAAQGYARDDLNATASFEIASRLGWIALQNDDLKEARRQLLSAAFGMPREPYVNLWLGNVYEEMGKLTRAWSRYVQSALDKEAPPEAMQGLDRLGRNEAFRAAFTMDEAEELLEGRSVEFHAADRHVELSDEAANIRVIELFSNVDNIECLAAELAFNGLREYYEGSDVVVLSYYLPVPGADPLVNRVGLKRGEYYGVQRTPTAVFDGMKHSTEGGDDMAIDRVYQAYRDIIAAQSRRVSPWRLYGEAALQDGTIRGKVTVEGPRLGDELRLRVYLTEEKVLIPAGNAVLLHREVVRSRFSGENGTVFRSDDERILPIEVSLAAVEADLLSQVEAQEAGIGGQFYMKPTYLDAGQLHVVALLQDESSGEIVTALRVPVTQ